MVPSHHLWFCVFKTATLAPELHGSQPSSEVFACKTATLEPELQVSRVPDLTNGFLHSKGDFNTRIASLCVPDLTFRFVHAKQRD